MRGKVLKFDRSKGFGFIISADDPTDPDYFVHHSAIEQNAFWKRQFLLPGMSVEFDVEVIDAEQEKFRAIHVQAIPPVIIAVQRSTPKPAAADPMAPIRPAATYVPALLRNMPKTGSRS